MQDEYWADSVQIGFLKFSDSEVLKKIAHRFICFFFIPLLPHFVPQPWSFFNYTIQLYNPQRFLKAKSCGIRWPPFGLWNTNIRISGLRLNSCVFLPPKVSEKSFTDFFGFFSSPCCPILSLSRDHFSITQFSCKIPNVFWKPNHVEFSDPLLAYGTRKLGFLGSDWILEVFWLQRNQQNLSLTFLPSFHSLLPHFFPLVLPTFKSQNLAVKSPMFFEGQIMWNSLTQSS